MTPVSPIILETQRLEWRGWTLAAFDALLGGRRDEAAATLGVALSHDFPNEEYRDILPWVRDRLQANPERGGWDGVVVQRDGPTAVGTMGFKAPPDEAGKVEIGYGILPAYRGRGYASELVAALTAWAFLHGATVVEARTRPDNIPAHRVLERAGFRVVDGSPPEWLWQAAGRQGAGEPNEDGPERRWTWRGSKP